MSFSQKIILLFMVLVTVSGCVNKEKAIQRKIKVLEEEAGLAVNTKNYELAEKKMEAILEIKPDAEYVKNNLAVLCAQFLNKQDKAIELWESILETSPKNSAYINNIAGLFWQKGELDKALEYYRRSALYHPTYHMPHFNMAQIYIEKNMFPEAEDAAYKGYSVAQTDSRMMQMYVNTMLYNGKFNEGLRLLTNSRNASPKVLSVNIKLVRMLIGSNELDKAEKILNETMGEYPMNPMLLAEMAEIYLQKGKSLEEIQSIAKQVIACNPQMFNGWISEYFQGRKLIKDQQSDLGIQRLESLKGKIPPALNYFEGIRIWELQKAGKISQNQVGELMKKAFLSSPERIPVPAFLSIADSEEME